MEEQIRSIATDVGTIKLMIHSFAGAALGWFFFIYIPGRLREKRRDG